MMKRRKSDAFTIFVTVRWGCDLVSFVFTLAPFGVVASIGKLNRAGGKNECIIDEVWDDANMDVLILRSIYPFVHDYSKPKASNWRNSRHERKAHVA